MNQVIDKINKIKWNEHGLVPAIIQSANDDRILMLAWMNAESLELTMEKRQTVFYSRSRQELWHKGATSGNTQAVESIELDCDSDSLLIRVREAGPACHTGEHSCFDSETLELS